jgi:hypothetical protein
VATEGHTNAHVWMQMAINRMIGTYKESMAPCGIWRGFKDILRDAKVLQERRVLALDAYSTDGIILWSSFVCNIIKLYDTLKPLISLNINEFVAVIHEIGGTKFTCDTIKQSLAEALPSHTKVADSDVDIFNQVS